MADLNEAEGHLISRLGHGGDGVAATEDGPRFVVGALPGERWRIGAGGAELVSAPSADRQSPPCRHFERCGGCVAQHMGSDLYAAWKRDIVVNAFAHRGIVAGIEPLVRIPAGTRRRCVLTGVRTGGALRLGFRPERSHDLVEIEECPVLVDDIVAALPALSQIVGRLAASSDELRLTVTATTTGLDCVVSGCGRTLTAEDRVMLARVAETGRLAAITVDGEEVVQRARPALDIAGVRVALPPGSFLQAAREAETAMTELVVAAAGSARSIADLYSGVGTFALPLSRRARVLAVDSDGAALGALAEARRHTQGLKPIETRQRDLMREPLSRKELEPFDCVVLDPPRAGAKAQAEMLAKSKVATVVAVSCDPGTLARDLRILLAGGYTLERVTPIDQFVWSAHVEVVAVLKR